jgi:hypothetical protein
MAQLTDHDMLRAAVSANLISPQDALMAAEPSLQPAPVQPAPGSPPPAKAPRTYGWLISAVAIAAVIVWWQIIVHTTHDKSIHFKAIPPKPVDGVTIFAVFFVAAAAIERLLEPIASLLPNKTDLDQQAQDSKAVAGAKLSGAVKAGVADPKSVAAAAIDKAIADKASRDRWVLAQTVGFWAVATALGIWASALLKLYLPYVIGIASGGRAIQILATGLVIGGGTKPLHDLVGYISAAKGAKAKAAS